MQIINKAKKTDNWKDALKNGLVDKDGELLFKRDTISKPILGSLFPANFNADSIRYIPYLNGTSQFELEAKLDTIASGPAKFFEARTLYTEYLKGLDEQEIINITHTQKQVNKYPGLKVGSMDEPLTAGNWESL